MSKVHQKSTAIRETLRFVAGSGMPLHHKGLLLDVVGEALRKMEEDEQIGVVEPEALPWRDEEVQLVSAHLEGKRAMSWQHADELAMGCAQLLNRRLEEVRQKAAELGFSAGVDYRVARAMAIRDSDA